MVQGLSTLIAGAYRMRLIVTKHEDDMISRWECIKAPHFVLMTFAQVAQAAMLLIVSIDRFIAILKPLKYLLFSIKYALGLVGACYLFAVIHTTFLLVYVHYYDESNPQTRFVHVTCFTADVDVLNTMVYVRFVLGGLSIFVYITVGCLFVKYRRTMVANFPTMKTKLRTAQVRLTVTVGICALFTVIFYLLPTGLLFININSNYFATIYWILTCCNAVVNVFVYSLRHVDIRNGLKHLFSCTQMPSAAAIRLHSESLHSTNTVAGKAALIFLHAIGSTVSSTFASKQIFSRRLNSVISLTNSSDG
jgi:hypothetical protein